MLQLNILYPGYILYTWYILYSGYILYTWYILYTGYILYTWLRFIYLIHFVYFIHFFEANNKELTLARCRPNESCANILDQSLYIFLSILYICILYIVLAKIFYVLCIIVYDILYILYNKYILFMFTVLYVHCILSIFYLWHNILCSLFYIFYLLYLLYIQRLHNKFQ